MGPGQNQGGASLGPHTKGKNAAYGQKVHLPQKAPKMAQNGSKGLAKAGPDRNSPEFDDKAKQSQYNLKEHLLAE